MRLRLALALLLLPAIAHGQAFRLGQGAQMTCRSAAPTAASSRGIVWCKSTDSDALYYTTPAGVSAAVGGGGGSGDMVLADVQTVTGAKTFNHGALKLFASGNAQSSTLATLASASRTWTLPDETDTAVGLAATQTLTNKTLTAPVIDSIAATAATAKTITSAAADASTNVGITFNNSTTLSGGRALAAFNNNGTEKLRIDPSGILLFSVNGAGSCNAAGTYCLVLNTASVGLYAPTGTGFQPETDQINYLGNPSKRWSVAFVGDAAADQPACDATTRGGIMTVFAAGGASDTVQACMKAAADTYAWRTVYTAP
jgi:hypothetical protein